MPDRRTTLWVAVGAAVLAAAVATTLVLTSSADEPPRADEGYDLSTPERAARSFVAAAVAGDGTALLELTCIAHPECVSRQGQVSPDQVEEARQVILDGMDQVADQLRDAEFGEASEAALPGAVEVGYTAPDTAGALIFVELDGDWLYVGSAGATT